MREGERNGQRDTVKERWRDRGRGKQIERKYFVELHVCLADWQHWEGVPKIIMKLSLHLASKKLVIKGRDKSQSFQDSSNFLEG